MIEILEPEVARDAALELGLTESEYEMVVEVQGRSPSLTELYMYSLMWSEHCSYKHSRAHLSKFPTTGERVLQGPGENAGVISVGDGWAVAFKMESHNHPSAIEPFEGAATGIGGCARDIFAMGARPIAALCSNRFGPLDQDRQRYLLKRAGDGASFYSSRIGVPLVGGDVYFAEPYVGNCLINAMVVGLLREQDLTRAVGSGAGNKVVAIGSTTGRDGIGAASILASQEFSTPAEDERPSVQAGDPFQEQAIIEACLDLRDRGLFVALGDLGAAGFTSAASEMASRGGVGIEIDVTRIPQREEGMEPYEIMVSESQERMLAVVTPEDVEEVISVCASYGTNAVVIGEITDTGRFVVREGEKVVADMPAARLADDAPKYYPEHTRPDYLDELAAYDPAEELDLDASVEDATNALTDLLASPNICSRHALWEGADHQVQNNTVVAPGADAAVVRIGMPGRGEVTDRGIAVSTDCNGRYVYLDPRRGAAIALAEAARNVSCVGAVPAAITDCLNFGNPMKPEVYYTFVESIEGIADACRALDVPVVSGNVSFHNESAGVPIYPTPSIGIVGVVEDLGKVVGGAFQDEGDMVVLLGQTEDELGGSEYLAHIHDVVAGEIPALDVELERDVQAALRAAIDAELVKSAHDCSDGGVAVALAESCITGEIGAVVALDDGLPVISSLFSETQSRVVVSCAAEDIEALEELLSSYDIPFSVIGTVGGDRITIEDKVDVSLVDAQIAYESALQSYLG